MSDSTDDLLDKVRRGAIVACATLADARAILVAGRVQGCRLKLLKGHGRNRRNHFGVALAYLDVPEFWDEAQE